MASIDSYETKAGKRWMVQYRTPDRRLTKKRGFKTKRDANEWLQGNEVAMRQGGWQPESAGRITVSELAAEHLRAKAINLAPKTASAYKGYLKHYEKYGNLGNQYVKDVTIVGIEKFVLEMSKELAPKSVRNSFQFLYSVFQRGIRDQRILKNPCVGVELPALTESEPRFLTVEQVAAFVAAAGENEPIAHVLVKTGMRWGEMAGLLVKDVDFCSGVIHVRRQKTELNGKLFDSAPKHGRVRKIPIIPSLRPVLEKSVSGKGQDELVLTTRRGAVLRSGNERRGWFDNAAKEAGAPGLTPHDLRHTFASLAIKSGANPKALQAMMGHTSIKITMDRYSHLYPEDYSSFTTGFDALFS